MNTDDCNPLVIEFYCQSKGLLIGKLDRLLFLTNDYSNHVYKSFYIHINVSPLIIDVTTSTLYVQNILQAGQFIINRYNCRLPWMNPKEFDEEYLLCEPEGGFTDLLADWDKAVKNAEKTCQNIPQCKRSLYSVTSERIPGKVASEIRAIIKLELGNTAVQFIEDSYYYDAQSLIGEVGGTMGLLLGLSFLSFFDFIDYLVRSLCQL